MKKRILWILSIVLTVSLLCIIYTKIGAITGNNTLKKISEIYNSKEEKNFDNPTENKVIGNLEIKKISLNGPIKEGSDSKVLKEYIGHIEETPIYNGNVCLAAHNRGNKYSYFSRINELKEGDEIIYNTDIYSKRYKVSIIKEIDETDWRMLEDSSENKITLITCIKNKKTKRLCVQALEV